MLATVYLHKTQLSIPHATRVEVCLFVFGLHPVAALDFMGGYTARMKGSSMGSGREAGRQEEAANRIAGLLSAMAGEVSLDAGQKDRLREVLHAAWAGKEPPGEPLTMPEAYEAIAGIRGLGELRSGLQRFFVDGNQIGEMFDAENNRGIAQTRDGPTLINMRGIRDVGELDALLDDARAAAMSGERVILDIGPAPDKGPERL